MRTLLLVSILAQPALAATQSIVLSTTPATAAVPNRAPYNSVGNLRIVMRLTAWSQPAATQNILLMVSASPYLNQFGIEQSANTNTIRLKSFADTQSQPYTCDLDLTPLGQDVILEFVRDKTNTRLRCHGWNVDGSATVAPSDVTGMPPMPNVTTAGTWYLGLPQMPATVDYIRIYYDNAYSVSPPPPLSPGTPALAWEFEGNGWEINRAADWTITGANFVTNAIKPPAIFVANPPYTVSTNTATGLDASASYPISTAGAMSYSWAKASGPGMATISGGSTPTPSVSVDTVGTYTIRATVTDALGNAGSRDLTIHAAVADANGVVSVPDARIARLLGPLIRFGANPWPWFDSQNKVMADATIAAANKFWPAFWQNETQPGTTCQITTNSAALVCSGTTLSAAFCQSGTSCDYAHVKGRPTGDSRITLWAASEDYPGEFIRRSMVVSSVQDDTHLTLSQPWIAYYATTCSNGSPAASCALKWTADSDADAIGAYYNWGCTYCNHANYYDSFVLALYALYYRTGDSSYLTQARIWADQWWEFPRIARGTTMVQNHIDGSGFFEGRSHALLGLIVRALDGRPEIWKGLSHFYEWYAYYNDRNSTGNFDNIGDGRELGYLVTSLAACSLYAPGNQPVTAPAWYWTSGTLQANCTAQLQKIANFLNANPRHAPHGNFQNMNNVMGSNGGGSGLGNQSLARVTTGSATVSKAPSSPTATQWSYLIDANTNLGGLWYASYPLPMKVWFASSATPVTNADGDAATYNAQPRYWKSGSGLTSIVVLGGNATATLAAGHGLATGGSITIAGSAAAGLNGTVTLTGSASATVTWSTSAAAGTYTDATILDNDHFTLDRPYEATGCQSGCVRGWFVGGTPGYGTQPFMQGLAGNAFGLAYYAMIAAGDNAHATLYKQFALDSVRWLWKYGRRSDTGGLYYGRDFPGCERNLTTGLDIPAGTHYECTYGDDPANSRVLLGEAQNAMSMAYELSPTTEFKTIGDGFYTAMWAKPGATSQFPGDGNYLSPMDSGSGYMTTVDAGGALAYFTSNKWLGFFFGKGGGYSWPAARLLTTTDKGRTLQVATSGQTPPATAVLRVTLRRNGTVQQFTCGDPKDCALPVDLLPGDGLISIDYLSPAGKTLRLGSSLSTLRIAP